MNIFGKVFRNKINPLGKSSEQAGLAPWGLVYIFLKHLLMKRKQTQELSVRGSAGIWTKNETVQRYSNEAFGLSVGYWVGVALQCKAVIQRNK